MVKTKCILVGQSGCSRAVADPDRQIRAGGGGAVMQTLRQRGGSGLKFFLKNRFRLGSALYERGESNTEFYAKREKSANREMRGGEKNFFFSLVLRFGQNVAFASLGS